jgi:hypothetical protein
MEDKIDKIEKGSLKVWFDEENKIGRIFISGQFDIPLIADLFKGIDPILNGPGAEANWLVDVSKVTKHLLSSKLRTTVLEGVKKIPKYPAKVAMLGGNVVVKVAAKFILNAAGYKGINFFETEEEAIKWLKED